MYTLLFMIVVWIAPAVLVLALGLWAILDLKRQLWRPRMAAKRPGLNRSKQAQLDEDSQPPAQGA
jgi:hypothetical protein